MNIVSLQNYLFSSKINKKDYLFIKEFCSSNKIEIIDFFKKGESYDEYAITYFFEQALSKTVNDEKMIEYFLSKKDLLPTINFLRLLDWSGTTVKYQHLLGLNKEEELALLIKKEELSKILLFLKANSEYQENSMIKNLIIKDFSQIEKFEKAKINFNQNSYNQLDIKYNNVCNSKEHNPNFIKVDKFYDFIESNKDKISTEKRKEYLKAIIGYGGLTVFDFTKKSYWDYVFIPLLHEKEFPELKEERNFFADILKYKEQIFSNIEPYDSLKIISTLTAEEKKELLMTYIKSYKIKEFNSTTVAIFTHFIKDVEQTFINDFFKIGIESGYLFRNSLKEDFVKEYDSKKEKLYIEYYSKIFDNDTVKNNYDIIAKQIIGHIHLFKENILKNYLPLNKEILDKKDFIISLNNDEVNYLAEELKNKGLPKTSARLMEIRLENKLQSKGNVEKKLKI